MEECSLDLIFLLGAARPFGFLVGEGLFFQKMKLDFLRQSESIYSCHERKLVLYNWYKRLYGRLTS